MNESNAIWEDFDMVISSMKKGLVNPKNYVTHPVKFGHVKYNFESCLNSSTSVIKPKVEL